MRAETQCLVACRFFINRVKSVGTTAAWTSLEQRLWLLDNRLEGQEITIWWGHKSETLHENVEKYCQSAFS